MSRRAGWGLMLGGLAAFAWGGWEVFHALEGAREAAGSWKPLTPAALALALGGGLFAVGLWVWLRGMAKARATPATFLHPAEEASIVEAIEAFEKRTSGELRVHLDAGADADVYVAARRTFEALGLTQTRDRNGVLFFVDVTGHRFAVVGDEGIHSRVGPGFWDEVIATVRTQFAQQQFADGLVQGIARAGEALVTHFPARADDVNELPNAISRGAPPPLD